MGPLLRVDHIKPSSEIARNQILSSLTESIQYSRENEQNITKYAICTPVTESENDSSLYIIQEHEDQAALDTHLKTISAQKVEQLLQDETLLEEPHKRFALNTLFSVSRPEADTSPEPYINFAEVSFQPDTSSQYLPYFQRIFESTRDTEEGTLVYSLAQRDGEPDKLYTLESYINKAYLWDVHVAGDAVQENKRMVGHLRTNLKHTFLKYHSGWFHR